MKRKPKLTKRERRGMLDQPCTRDLLEQLGDASATVRRSNHPSCVRVDVMNSEQWAALERTHPASAAEARALMADFAEVDRAAMAMSDDVLAQFGDVMPHPYAFLCSDCGAIAVQESFRAVSVVRLMATSGLGGNELEEIGHALDGAWSFGGDTRFRAFFEIDDFPTVHDLEPARLRSLLELVRVPVSVDALRERTIEIAKNEETRASLRFRREQIAAGLQEGDLEDVTVALYRAWGDDDAPDVTTFDRDGLRALRACVDANSDEVRACTLAHVRGDAVARLRALRQELEADGTRLAADPR